VGTKLQRAIEAVDRHLTGKVEPSVRSRYPKTILDWLEQDSPVYLSDGGYSRLEFLFNGEPSSIKVGLASESTARVKARWHSARPLVAKVVSQLKREYFEVMGESLERSPLSLIED